MIQILSNFSKIQSSPDYPVVNKKGLASLTHEYKIRAKNIKAVLNILPEVCRSYTGYHLPGIKKGTSILQLEYCRHGDFRDMS